jgi:hypothetical protein
LWERKNESDGRQELLKMRGRGLYNVGKMNRWLGWRGGKSKGGKEKLPFEAHKKHGLREITKRSYPT